MSANLRILLLTLSLLATSAAGATTTPPVRERAILKKLRPDSDRGRHVSPVLRTGRAFDPARTRSGCLDEPILRIDLRPWSNEERAYRLDPSKTDFLRRRRHRYGVPARHGIDIAPSPASSGTLPAEWIVH
jgi:hypothetical protein